MESLGGARGDFKRPVQRSNSSLPAQRLVNDMPPSAVQSLQQRLYRIEPATRLDAPSVQPEAQAICDAAARIDAEPERLRAELVLADIGYRQGDLVTGGQTAERIRAWAETHQDNYLLARAYRVLGGHYFRLGDDVNGLRAAVDCLRLLPPGVPDHIHLDHILCVGDCLARAGSLAAATVEYRKALEIAHRLGDEAWLLVSLNNFLITLADEGRYDEADGYITQMTRIADEERLKLDYCYLDTFATIALGRGDFQRVKELLGPVLEDGFEDVRNDPYGLGDCLITYISACQQFDDLESAHRGLQAARAIERRHHIELPEIRLLKLEAEHAYRTGDPGTAYALQLRAFNLLETSRTDERDARSRLLHSVFATEKARADSGKFQRLALLDPLTGLGNRRFVNETLPIRVDMHAATHLAVGLIDLDYFKQINDEFSHAAGDVVLQEFALLVADHLGMEVMPTDNCTDAEHQWNINIMKAYQDPSAPYVARMGGEEFLLVMMAPDASYAMSRCEQLLCKLRSQTWGVPGLDRPVTASIGLVHGTAGHTMSTLLELADQLLYDAKRAGRDRVAWQADPLG